MIGRLGAAGAAVAPIALNAMQTTGATVDSTQPVVWHFLGYPFEAAGFIAAIGGCLVARFWIGAGQALRREHRWSLDLPVTSAVLLLTVGIIIARRPEPLMGLVYGLGAGVLGEGVFKVADRYMRRVLRALTDDDGKGESA